jgi:GTPase SAR1 family protein
MNQLIEDQIVIRVLSRFSERSQVGINKYNTTLERTDLSTLEWLTHAQEEAMDFVLYLERLKDEYRGGLLTKMVKQSEQDGLYEENVKRTMPK